jgi:hypothetical protein
MRIIILFGLLFSSSIYADCIYNGTSYPTGTVIGGLVCKEDGTWGKKEDD